MQQEKCAAEIRWPNAIWAWEFLRRNQDYRQAFERHKGLGPKQMRLPSGSQLVVGDARYEAARQWGLLYFANPGLSAFEAGVFWKPSLFAATIPVSLRDPEREKDRERYAGSDETDMVILSELCCQRLIFESVNQSRHIRLAPRRFWIQLYCDSTYPLDDNALINFRI
ncbi:MAG: transcriptional regulator domain-containing protein, partial [Mangrovicoccus sp.]